MKFKILIFPCLFAFSNVVFAIDITVTNALVQGKTEFYTQSSAGTLTTCGVEFSGVDSKLNYFSGSFSLLNLGGQNIVPILKVKSSLLNLDGTTKARKLQKAWLRSPDHSTLSTQWVSENVDDYITAVGRDIEEGVELYTDIVKGKDIKIGYLHQGASIDLVFLLRPFPSAGEQLAGSCLIQMLDQAIKQ